MRPHSVQMTDRTKAVMTGVVRVDSSGATQIDLMTSLGKLVITGTELKIDKFDVNSGDLEFSGHINGIKYADAKQPLLKRIFKLANCTPFCSASPSEYRRAFCILRRARSPSGQTLFPSPSYSTYRSRFS